MTRQAKKRGQPPRRRFAYAALSIIMLAATIYLVIYTFDSKGPTPYQPTTPVTQNPQPEDPVQPNDPVTPPPVTQSGLKQEFYTFLLVGSMDDYNTDTIMLASIDAKTHECNIISIPRDSQVDNDAKYKKINNAYGRAGMDELLSEVQSISGVYPQYWCFVNVESFTDIVDQVGGVPFYVPYNMYHYDGDNTINLKEGDTVLNSNKALQLVRYRGTRQNDYGRIELQKSFLLATLKQVKNEFSIAKIPGLLGTINESVKTNMPLTDMIWFYRNVLNNMDLDTDITFHTMPTIGPAHYKGQDYELLDEKGILELVNKTVNPFTHDITSGDIKISSLKD